MNAGYPPVTDKKIKKEVFIEGIIDLELLDLRKYKMINGTNDALTVHERSCALPIKNPERI